MTEDTQSTAPIWSVGLKYGLGGSMIAIGLFFAMFGLDENPLIWTAPKVVAYSVLFLAFPVLAIVEFKRYHLVSKWRFWYGLALGIVVYGIICLTTLIVAFTTLQFSPDLVDSYRETSLQSLESNREEFVSQFGEERYAQTKETVQMISAWDIAMDDFLKKLLLGFFLTATIALAFSIIASLRAKAAANP